MPAPEAQSTRALSLALAGAIVLAIALLFGRTATYEFCNFDDQPYVTMNPHVCRGLNLENALWALTSTECANWHPLTWWSLELDASLYGLRAGGFHITNVVLHAANSVLLLVALRKMTGALVPSACVAGLFAIHPLHVESVAWVAERKDVLCTLFWMLALVAYARYAERPSPWRYSQVVIAMVLGLMAKPMLVTLPCVLLLVDFWPLRRWRPKVEVPGSSPQSLGWLVVEKLPLLAISVIFCVVTAVVQSGGGAVADVAALPVRQRLMNVPVAYVAYLEKMVWPAQLCVYYPHPTWQQPLAVSLIAAALVIGASIWICRRWRRQPYLAVGWFWYLGTLVPVIGLVQIGSQGIADRYTYVPLIGVFMAIVWWFVEWVERGVVSRRLLVALAGASFVSLAACTWVQVGVWRDSITLWDHALGVQGPHYVICANLGDALLHRGQLKEAVECLRISTKAAPHHAPARSALGWALFQIGQRDEAEEELREALRLDARYAPAHGNLGLVLRARGLPDDAVAHFREVLRINPVDGLAHQALGETLVALGKVDEGRRHLREAKRLNFQSAAGAEIQ